MDRDAERIFRLETNSRYAGIEKLILRKLLALQAANSLSDLRTPPGNRFEALIGSCSGQHGLRLNSQFRLCFIWREGEAHEVEIADYH